MRILILLLLISLQYQSGRAQIVFKNIESEVTRNAFIQFNDFLIKHPTDTLSRDSKIDNLIGWAFYDSVIDKFFNRSRMISEFRNHKGGYDFSSLMAIQYHTLYSIDKAIDHIPDDSVFVLK